MTPNDPLIDTKEHARIRGVSPSKIEHERLAGEGPPYIKTSRRCVRYRLSDVNAWLDVHRRTA